ncbi:unnamed protein product [Gongylonema pulchrum]|uniref:HTH_48 domain-containing protein n=1 Tax=Gongylonema pulchrum TaxID=637853 RepID=A0A183D179_9BILA|nr:unnamed protein product [Gongylonema pulchrum]
MLNQAYLVIKNKYENGDGTVETSAIHRRLRISRGVQHLQSAEDLENAVIRFVYCPCMARNT